MADNTINRNNFKLAEVLFSEWLTTEEMVNKLKEEGNWSQAKVYRTLGDFKLKKIVNGIMSENYENKYKLNSQGAKEYFEYYNKFVLPELNFKNIKKFRKLLFSLKNIKRDIPEEKVNQINIPLLLAKDKSLGWNVFSKVFEVKYKVNKKELTNAIVKIKKVEENI